MKSLIMLQQYILDDLGMWCDTSTTRDQQTITRRFEHEGLSFLTITLSNFGKDFQKSLDLGFVGHDQFVGFSRTGGLPRFLGGFLDLVFDRNSGRLLENPSIDAIRAIRQFTLMWAKMNLECTEERTRAALKKYLQSEQDLKRSDARLHGPESYRLHDFTRIGRLLWADYFSHVDSRIYNDTVMPKHGPGSTADKLRGNAKYNQSTWTRRLESVFPHWEHLIPSESFLDRTDGVRILEPGEEMPVEVISVPKTLSTPRIIALEPTCMQYMQQGILARMVEEMPGHSNPANLLRFESQEPNQRLAREGSTTGALATLDLSEASDRVSNQHVRLLLSNHRALRDAVDASRSRKADVLGKTIRLTKFASMGSALTFPFEALVFTTIVFIGIERVLNRRLTQKDVESFYGRVRLYGDDIIVPVEYVESVIQELEAFGLLVNRNKSFWTGKFRESCGAEFYDGFDVTITKLRRLLPETRLDVRELESAVAFRNDAWKRGLWKTVDYLDELIGSIIPFPVVEPTSVLLGRHDFSLPSQAGRHDPHFHYPLEKGVVVVGKSPVSNLDDYGALMKWFLKRGSLPFQDKDHLERAGRPRSPRIKTRWARPY